MLHDRTHRIDQRGRVFIVEELDKPLPATTAAAAGSTGLIDGTLAPLDQTFLLHSKPGAKRTIYLNFKGATLSGTAWNSAGTITALPFDTDGVPYTFSTAELQRIQYIWQRVAEDYAAFDVNVTTEAVPLEQIIRAGSTDDVFGTTVLITSSTGVYNCSCGGVAYLGVFDDTSEFYKPALVFYNQLGGGNEKYVAEAISHEAGHNMGLNHDGTATFTVSPAARSANLDAWVGLRDAAGNLLANINPADALNASFSVVLPAAGTYTLSVQGTGKGDPLTTGYTNYGSLGQYAVTASYPTPGSLAPTAVITASTLRGTAPLTVNFSGTGSSDADGSLVAYDWSFGDATTASGSTAAHTYGTPGSYSAVLRATDNSGLSASSSVIITVDAPVVVVPMSVADIAMSLKLAKNGSATATAAVKVLDVNGLPVAGASVAGSWSGLVARNSTVTTDSTGVARFTSPSSRSSGTFRFTVNSVVRSGYTYTPLNNTETTDFINR
jgi:hypothetical protein